MAILVHKCPHCVAERITLDVYGQSHIKDKASSRFRKFAFLRCRECGMPSVVEINSASISALTFEDLRSQVSSLNQLGYVVVDIWPKAPTPRIPDHLPDQVARALLAAERNYPLKGMEEASAGSYGRALDIGTKLLAPDLANETLYNRIRKLADQHRITDDLAAWAHEIRLIRNDALHDVDCIDREELTAIRGFAELVLTYLFTLPGMLAARKAAAAGGGTAPTT